jgi:hypothetical protein
VVGGSESQGSLKGMPPPRAFWFSLSLSPLPLSGHHEVSIFAPLPPPDIILFCLPQSITVDPEDNGLNFSFYKLFASGILS